MPANDIRIIALIPFDGVLGEELRSAGATVHTASMPASPPWRSIQFACELVRRHGVALLHAHLASAHQLGAIVGRATRTPVLATIHAMHVAIPDLEAHRLGGTHLCLVSEAARMHALSVGAAPERLRVIRNAVDTATFSPAAAPRAQRPLTIGFVGRLSPEKGPLLFVAIAARVAEALPDVRFVVAGDGPMRHAMADSARSRGLADRFEFRGLVTSMPALYRELDLMLLTSSHEGTPLAVLEAMATGVPVVATDVGGVPELVASGMTGRLFAAGSEAGGADAVLALARDAARRRRMGVEARARTVAHFGWPQHVAQVTGAWRALAADGRRRGLRGFRPPDGDEGRRTG